PTSAAWRGAYRNVRQMTGTSRPHPGRQTPREVLEMAHSCSLKVEDWQIKQNLVPFEILLFMELFYMELIM
ncbi:hypothetical protein, partial [Candidatus Amarolinea dominans]|uniref:hypothetical protein n=1 Tax=Candidatus Amarolinea dominans TaxID=3140696 RepID=UPI0031CCB641